MTIDPDFAYCRQILPTVSRTFALGIELMQTPLRDEIGIAYLICRILDTVEDTTSIDAKKRISVLHHAGDDLLRKAAWPAAAIEIQTLFGDTEKFTGPDFELCRHCGQVLNAYFKLRPDVHPHLSGPIIEMARGMAATVTRELNNEGLHIQTISDLEQYCYYVAGTVGKLLTAVFGHDRKSIDAKRMQLLESKSIAFGLALQVTNIIKGVMDDSRRGVSYFPQQLLGQSGVTLKTLAADPNSAQAKKAVQGLVSVTLIWMDAAVEYTLAIPEKEQDIRLFCALPIVFALRTLRLAMHSNSVFSEDALKITRAEVAELHEKVQTAIQNNVVLKQLFGNEKKAIFSHK